VIDILRDVMKRERTREFKAVFEFDAMRWIDIRRYFRVNCV